MLLAYEAAYRIGRRRWQEADEAPESTGAISSALFALLGLLLAFTFSGAWSRLDTRRQLIVQEANAIGTAYLRLDLLPAEAQPPLREGFRHYTDSRAAFYQYLTDRPAAQREAARTAELEGEIWSRAVAATQGSEHQAARLLLLPALNEMFDIVTTRSVAIRTHPPLIIWIVLATLALTCAGMTGYAARKTEHPKRWYAVVLAAVTALLLYLILDIEYPRYGIVRLDSVNQLLIDLSKSLR
jgi:hypothetical protein